MSSDPNTNQVVADLTIRHSGVTPAAEIHFAGTIVVRTHSPDSSENIWSMPGPNLTEGYYSVLMGELHPKKQKIVAYLFPDDVELLKSNPKARFYVFGSTCNHDIFKKWRLRNFCFSFDARGGDEKDCPYEPPRPYCRWFEE